MKAVSFKRGDVSGPPSGEPWTWHSLTLLSSMAWRGRSVGLSKLLEFLEIELLRHAGLENGNLLATYDQLVAFRISRRTICAAIMEGERRGLIRACRSGRDLDSGEKLPTRYRLTYLAWKQDGVWHAPSNEWRRFTTANQALKPTPGKNQKRSSTKDTAPVPQRTLGQKKKTRISAKSQVPQRTPSSSATKDTAIYISRGRGSDEGPGQPPSEVPA